MKRIQNIKFFLAIFWTEITTILTASTSEGEVEVVAFFVLKVPDYESSMLIYLYIYIKLQDLKSVIG